MSSIRIKAYKLTVCILLFVLAGGLFYCVKVKSMAPIVKTPTGQDVLEKILSKADYIEIGARDDNSNVIRLTKTDQDRLIQLMSEPYETSFKKDVNYESYPYIIYIHTFSNPPLIYDIDCNEEGDYLVAYNWLNPNVLKKQLNQQDIQFLLNCSWVELKTTPKCWKDVLGAYFTKVISNSNK